MKKQNSVSQIMNFPFSHFENPVSAKKVVSDFLESYVPVEIIRKKVQYCSCSRDLKHKLQEFDLYYGIREIFSESQNISFQSRSFIEEKMDLEDSTEKIMGFYRNLR